MTAQGNTADCVQLTRLEGCRSTKMLVPTEAEEVQREARLTTILLIGRVSTDTRDDLCRVRNISASGMLIETMAEIDIGQRVRVELKNGVPLPAVVVWVGNAEAGVRFNTPVDIEQVLAPVAQSHYAGSGRIMRSPRLSVRCRVALRRSGHILSGILIDISQGGALLEIDCATEVGDQLILFVPALGSRRATVRWVRNDDVGLLFAEKIGFTDLARWLAGSGRFRLEPATEASPIRQSS